MAALCVSLPDGLSHFAGPHAARTERCLRPPCPINHLFIQFEDYSCSFATSSPTCHGASRGRHPHSCIKAIQLLLHGNKLGRLEIPPASALAPRVNSHPSPPAPRERRAGETRSVPRCLPAEARPFGGMRFHLRAVCWEPVSVDRGVCSRVLLIRLLFPAFQPTPAHRGRWIVSGRPAGPEEARPATPSQRAAVHLLGGEAAHGGEGSRGPLPLICCRGCKSAGRRAGNLRSPARWSPGAPCSSVDKQIPRPDAWEPPVLFISYRRNSLSKSKQYSVEEGLRYTPGTEAVGPQLLHTGTEPQPPPHSAAPPSPRAKRNLWCLASPPLGLIEPLPEPRACLLTRNPISKSELKALDTVLSGSPACGVHSILFRKLHPFSKRFPVL